MCHSESDHSGSHSGPWDSDTADWYVARWGEHPLHAAVPDLSQLADGNRVLDIGCGSGSVVREIAARLSTGEVIGVDPTPRMVELAREQSRALQLPVPVRFIEAPAEQLPCPDQSCDLVLAINSLHHWQHVEAGLEEVQRVLKPGGRFVVIDDLWEEIQRHIGDLPVEPQEADDAHWLSPQDVAEALATAGFTSATREYRAPEIAVSVITAQT